MEPIPPSIQRVISKRSNSDQSKVPAIHVSCPSVASIDGIHISRNIPSDGNHSTSDDTFQQQHRVRLLSLKGTSPLLLRSFRTKRLRIHTEDNIILDVPSFPGNEYTSRNHTKHVLNVVSPSTKAIHDNTTSLSTSPRCMTRKSNRFLRMTRNNNRTNSNSSDSMNSCTNQSRDKLQIDTKGTNDCPPMLPELDHTEHRQDNNISMTLSPDEHLTSPCYTMTMNDNPFVSSLFPDNDDDDDDHHDGIDQTDNSTMVSSISNDSARRFNPIIEPSPQQDPTVYNTQHHHHHPYFYHVSPPLEIFVPIARLKNRERSVGRYHTHTETDTTSDWHTSWLQGGDEPIQSEQVISTTPVHSDGMKHTSLSPLRPPPIIVDERNDTAPDTPSTNTTQYRNLYRLDAPKNESVSNKPMSVLQNSSTNCKLSTAAKNEPSSNVFVKRNSMVPVVDEVKPFIQAQPKPYSLHQQRAKTVTSSAVPRPSRRLSGTIPLTLINGKLRKPTSIQLQSKSLSIGQSPRNQRHSQVVVSSSSSSIRSHGTGTTKTEHIRNTDINIDNSIVGCRPRRQHRHQGTASVFSFGSIVGESSLISPVSVSSKSAMNSSTHMSKSSSSTNIEILEVDGNKNSEKDQGIIATNTASPMNISSKQLKKLAKTNQKLEGSRNKTTVKLSPINDVAASQSKTNIVLGVTATDEVDGVYDLNFLSKKKKSALQNDIDFYWRQTKRYLGTEKPAQLHRNQSGCLT